MQAGSNALKPETTVDLFGRVIVALGSFVAGLVTLSIWRRDDLNKKIASLEANNARVEAHCAQLQSHVERCDKDRDELREHVIRLVTRLDRLEK